MLDRAELTIVRSSHDETLIILMTGYHTGLRVTPVPVFYGRLVSAFQKGGCRRSMTWFYREVSSFRTMAINATGR